MATLETNSDEYNRAVNRIADLNLTIDLFMKKFELFRKEFNFIDDNLKEKLENIVDVVEDFIDGEPEIINTELKTKIDSDYMQMNTIDSVYICNSCDEEIGKKFKEIRKHVAEIYHKDNLLKSLPSQNIVLPNNSQQKIQRIDNIDRNNEKQLSRSEKRKLKKEIFKNEKLKKRALKENLPKRAKLFISGNFKRFLTDSCECGNKLKILPNYENLGNSLLRTIKHVYPDARCHFFGSRISGLGTIDSDLDIFLNIGGVYNIYNESQLVIHKKLLKVDELLNKNPNEWKTFAKVRTARVPVLKVYNKIQQIECDIAFSNGLGPRNTLLIKYFCELQPLCHKMCIFIKEWLNLVELKGHFTTYTLALMVVFFLQIKNILPSVHVLQAEIKNPLMIGPWQGDFIEKNLRDHNIKRYDDSYESVKSYLYSFFEFYESFDYNKYVICPYLGRLIEKEIFNTTANPMKRYYNYYLLNKDVNSLQYERFICVQDPFEQNHNVSKSVSEGILRRFCHYCMLTAMELDQKKNYK